MGWRTFYWRWLGRAFSGALDRTALVAFVALSGVEVGKRFVPQMTGVLSSWVWAVPFWALAAVMLGRLVWAPFAIWRDQASELQHIRSEAETLRRELEAARRPPPPPARDPDGIYQRGRKVGNVVAPKVDLGTSTVSFEMLTDTADFDASKPFEYRDMTLELFAARSRIGQMMHASATGTKTAKDVIGGVTCRIIG